MVKVRRPRVLPVVAVINTNDDLVRALAETLEEEGYGIATFHIADIKSGRHDFTAFLAQHRPEAIIYDITIPYDDNWTFLAMLRRLPECRSIPFVVTTVNKQALDSRVGPTDTIEIQGGHKGDIEPTLDALRAALRKPRRHRRKN